VPKRYSTNTEVDIEQIFLGVHFRSRQILGIDAFERHLFATLSASDDDISRQLGTLYYPADLSRNNAPQPVNDKVNGEQPGRFPIVCILMVQPEYGSIRATAILGTKVGRTPYIGAA
jgi:hypothetical protein